MPRLSKGSIVGYATDTTSWGTHTTASAWLPVLSYTPTESRPPSVVPTMGRDGAAGLFSEEHVRERVDFAGRVEHHVHYQAGGMHFVILHAFGAVATSGAGPYVHTYTLGDKPALGLSATFNKGEAASDLSAGGRVSGFELRHVNGTDGDGLAVFAFDAIWKASENGEESKVSPTYTPITRKMLASQMSGYTWNGTDRKAYLLDYTLTVDRATGRAPGFGTKETADPIQRGPHVVTLTARFRQEDGSHYAAVRADTASDLVIGYTGTGNDAISLTLRNGIVASVAEERSASTNEVIETVTMQFFGDATDSPLTMAITNDASDPATN
ncbi:MAG: hypothetical protein ACO3RX_00060 [Chthoniobacterales bacterium]